MPERRTAYAALVVACLAWGVSFPLGKVALAEVGALHVVFLRFAIAALCFGALALWRRCGWPTRGEWGALVGVGFLMVPAVFVLQFEGLARTSVTRAALIVGAFPVVMALLARWRGGETLSARAWGVIALSTLGVAITLSAPSGAGRLLGDTLVLASIGASAAWVLATRYLLRRRGALFVTCWSLFFGLAWHTLIMLPTVGPPPLPLHAATWGALAGLGLLCTVVSYSLWNWSLHVIPASKAAVFVNLEPLVGALCGILLFGDRAGPFTLLGGLLIVGSAIVISRIE